MWFIKQKFLKHRLVNYIPACIVIVVVMVLTHIVTKDNGCNTNCVRINVQLRKNILSHIQRVEETRDAYCTYT